MTGLDPHIVGIDFGYNDSCVAMLKVTSTGHAFPEIIDYEDGNEITPNMISFFDNEVEIGEAAKNHMAPCSFSS
jgi:molecular chaperone DnaK (HSP70)